jgi:exopolysaccharide biosynthesis protein
VRDAVNLDDGGSTTIVSRLHGRGELTLLNHPSDGSERRVADGIGLFG